MKKQMIGIFVCTLLIATTLSVAGTLNVSQTNEKTVITSSEDDEWPMFHHDAENTGYSTSSAPDKNTIRWSKSFSGHLSYCEPIVADDKIFIWNNDGKVFCLNAHNGRRLWKYDTGYDYSIDSAVVANGSLYFNCGSSLFQLQAKNGKFINENSKAKITSGLTLADDRIYFGTSSGKVVCIDASDICNVIWTYQTPSYYLVSTPAVDDWSVWVGVTDGDYYNSYLCKLNKEGNGDGTTTAKLYELDQSSIGSVWAASPTIFNDTVYIATENYFYCLGKIVIPPMATWGIKWKYKLPDDSDVHTAAIYDGKVFIRVLSGEIDGETTLYCLDAKDGTEIWNVALGEEELSIDYYYCPAVADGKVYLGAVDKVYCLDADNGNVIWERTLKNLYCAIQVSVAYGRVYAISNGEYMGHVYCFGNKKIARDTSYTAFIERLLENFPMFERLLSLPIFNNILNLQ